MTGGYGHSTIHFVTAQENKHGLMDCLSEGVLLTKETSGRWEIKATGGGECKRTLCVCFQNKEKAGGKQIDRAQKSYRKWDSHLKKKIKINSSTPCALYMLIEGLLQTAGSPSNVL